MVQPKFLSRKEAAEACGCSEDTLRRDQRQGKLPRTRLGDDGVTRYAAADLVAVGRLVPEPPPANDASGPERRRPDGDLAAAQTELAVAQARLAELSSRIERDQEEIALLRSLLARDRVA